jgi:lysophospholipase L1-like esterase
MLASNTPVRKQWAWWFYAIGILLGLLVGELVARSTYYVLYGGQQDRLIRAFMGSAGRYNPNMVSNYVPHPYLVYALNPNTRYYEDFYGKKPQHLVNSLGFRGKEFSKEKATGVYRIICVGGSTTFSLHEKDESKTYPQMLEDFLNTTFDSPRFEVINAGTPGWTSAESLINLQFRLLELKPDMVIIYDGVNDTFAMRQADEGRSDYSNFRQVINYKQATAPERFLFNLSAIYRFYFIHTRQIVGDINALASKPYPPEQKMLENLDKATGKYFRSNMESMVVVAQSRGITPVLMTMGHGPWHPSLMQLNEITREVARAKGAVLVDFEVTSAPSYFLEDFVHLTREGNTAMARLLVDNLSRQNLPFHKTVSPSS